MQFAPVENPPGQFIIPYSQFEPYWETVNRE